jgi:hypothetical protein
MNLQVITDAAASPSVAVPIAAGVSVGNFLAFLPIAINALTFLYLLMLVGHKGWIWYKEWKGKQQIKDTEELP